MQAFAVLFIEHRYAKALLSVALLKNPALLNTPPQKNDLKGGGASPKKNGGKGGHAKYFSSCRVDKMFYY